MDFMTLFGLMAGAATVYYVMMQGNILSLLVDPVAFVLVFGGTLSATLIAYPWNIFRHVFSGVKLTFINKTYDENDRIDLIEQLAGLAEKARRSNVESIQGDIVRMDDSFMAYGLQMVVDGVDTDIIKDNLEKRILLTRQHNSQVGSVFRTMATLSPIFGLLGTLIGVVQVLRNLADPSSMGAAMAIAITTTFYGIFAANFIFLPAAIKLNEQNEGQSLRRQIIAEGILSINNGDLPSILKKKLNAFIISSLREQTRHKGA